LRVRTACGKDGLVAVKALSMNTADDPRSRAMHFLTLALQLLDESDVPADVGAHVDTAIVRLAEILAQSGEGSQKVSQ